MFIIPIQELDEIVNDHFGSGDAQTQSTNDEAESTPGQMMCMRRREMTHLTEKKKNKTRAM